MKAEIACLLEAADAVETSAIKLYFKNNYFNKLLDKYILNLSINY
jgi:hypothetical protein